jgi:mRNA interferase RelE/StbE
MSALMKYSLKFLPTALKEWKKLDNSIQSQFKKKLSERLEKPHVLPSKLSGFENHYKIKLRASGYRLVYEVIDNALFVLVIALGKRDRNMVYKKAKKNNEAFNTAPG